jgi:CheY-like chemotaxis protein
MADLSVPWEREQAEKGVAAGDASILKDLHDPGRQGTEVCETIQNRNQAD